MVIGLDPLREDRGEQPGITEIALVHPLDHVQRARLAVQTVGNHQLRPSAFRGLDSGLAVGFADAHGLFEQYM
ncbi:hypothetical protein, partial [uncultured Pseudomonas sp.]|uniref:hypothetical protein n=1 Tax=uncultured Pseudomonas sp. TaxID=114707 RepID=UPI0025956817